MTITAIVPLERNRLDRIASRIKNGHLRAAGSDEEWVEGTLELAAAMKDGRDSIPANIGFHDWLKERGLDFYSAHDRAALLNFADNLTMTRSILGNSKSRSYELIWNENRHRFASVRKTANNRKPRDRTGLADSHRRMKLGHDTVDKLKGTSLGSAPELNELIMLNRGAPEGELTDIVKQLVADAVAGKDVSAIAHGRGTAVPLMEAWKKRMAASWQCATKQEREEFISYLMDHIDERQETYGRR